MFIVIISINPELGKLEYPLSEPGFLVWCVVERRINLPNNHALLSTLNPKESTSDPIDQMCNLNFHSIWSSAFFILLLINP